MMGAFMVNRQTPLIIILILSLLLMITTREARSQDAPPGGTKIGGRGFFSMGTGMLKTDDLDGTLQAAGYPVFNEGYYLIGGEGYLMINRWVIGGEGHGIIGDEISEGIITGSLSGGQGFLTVGHTVFSNNRFKIYPKGGVGLGGLSMQLTGDLPPALSDMLDDPAEDTELSKSHALMKLGMNFAFLINLSSGEFGAGGFAIGLEAGYQFTFNESDWQIEEIDIQNGPDLNMTGPYIKLKIGGGGFGYR